MKLNAIHPAIGSSCVVLERLHKLSRLVLSFLLAIAAGSEPVWADDLPALQGRWKEHTMTIHAAEGTFVSPRKDARIWAFSGDQQTVEGGKEWNRVSLDQSKSPRRLTLTPMLGGGAPVSYAYTLSGDQLRLESAPLTRKTSQKPSLARNTADIEFELHRIVSVDMPALDKPTSKPAESKNGDSSAGTGFRKALDDDYRALFPEKAGTDPASAEAMPPKQSDVNSAPQAAKQTPGSKPLVVNGETFWVPPAMQEALAPELAAQGSASKGWPKFAGTLKGSRELRVKNPNEFSVKVGVRSAGKGLDFSVGPGKTASAFVPDGEYSVFFQYSNDPDGVYQGDDFSLRGHGVEIQIVKVINGNFNIRKVH